MKLFKEKKPREIKEDDSLLVKLWYNKRTHAMMVLGLYAIFFFIIILLSNISIHKTNNRSKNLNKDLEKYFANMDGKELSYNFVINKDDDIYYFSGSKVDENIIGKLLHNSDTETIVLNSDSCKVGSFIEDNFIPDDNILCPDFLNYELFNYNKVFDEINNNSSNLKKSNEYYLYINGKLEYRIYTKGELISRIDINDGSYTYNLNYYVNLLNEYENENINENNE